MYAYILYVRIYIYICIQIIDNPLLSIYTHKIYIYILRYDLSLRFSTLFLSLSLHAAKARLTGRVKATRVATIVPWSNRCWDFRGPQNAIFHGIFHCHGADYQRVTQGNYGQLFALSWNCTPVQYGMVNPARYWGNIRNIAHLPNCFFFGV